MIKLFKHHKFISIVSLLIIALGAVYYFHIRPANQIVRQPVPKATIKQLPTPTNTSTTSQPAGSTSAIQGTATDNAGQSPTPITSSQNQWTQSQSGVITLQQPIASSTIASGFVLNGLASVSSVSYTLIDNQSGVISQGVIKVVGGKFSATVGFKSTSTTGRLDVFSTDPNGKEINEVQIPVNF
jgi:hypothetical protein